ncbi:MAG: DUF4446 family protein [Candidatus Dormibacteraeota bacterium]|nr:DUF4446 family protein [Candidatus Dormibacteraeota bacterium]
MLLAGWLAATHVRLNRMVRHYRRLGRGVGADRLEQLLEGVMDRSELATREVAALRGELGALAGQVEGHLQRVGMVRYNAFEDTGGDQSFALALLDAHGNGAIFNGLYHRNDCKVYAKPVRAWKSSYSMSDEETEAIRKAREGAV